MDNNTANPTEQPLQNDPPKKINILSLDGGGIRGLYELWILEKITEQIMKWGGPKDWITQYFHLICGTSTGGLIALGLGTQGMSIEEIKNLYLALGAQVFNDRPKEAPNAFFAKLIAYKQLLSSIADGLNFITNTDKGCYKTVELEKLLQQHFKKPFAGRSQASANDIKVFVVATKDISSKLEPFLIRSYQHIVPEEATRNTHIHWVDGTQLASGGTTKPTDWEPWEAARATSAAPFYFDRYKFRGQTPFLDGGLVANNPTELALYEAFMTMGKDGRTPGLVLSLGTGTSPITYPDGTKSIFEWGGGLINLVTESDLTHKSVHRWRQSMKFFSGTDSSPFTYTRIDPPEGAQFLLDAVDKIAVMEDLVKTRVFASDEWTYRMDEIGKELHAQGLLPGFKAFH